MIVKEIEAGDRVKLVEQWLEGQRREVAAKLLKMQRKETVWFCFALCLEGKEREIMALHALTEAESRWDK